MLDQEACQGVCFPVSCRASAALAAAGSLSLQVPLAATMAIAAATPIVPATTPVAMFFCLSSCSALSSGHDLQRSCRSSLIYRWH